MSRHSQRGQSLASLVVIFPVLLLIGNIGVVALIQTFRFDRNLNRNADDIALALRAGELWRNDVRHAAAPPSLQADTLSLGSDAWRVADATLWHRRGSEAWAPVLRHVQRCTFQPIPEVPGAWRCELELTVATPSPKVRPRFSFIAVAPGGQP